MVSSKCRIEAPLFANRTGMSFAEAAVASRFHTWRGRSGHRYVASVYAIDAQAIDGGLPDFSASIVIAARRHGSLRVPIGVFRIERGVDRRAVVTSVLGNRADEWHVHLLACTHAARDAATADLRAQHATGAEVLANCA